MDIKRLLSLSGVKRNVLVESVTNDPEVNSRIDNALKSMSPERQSMYLDAAEILGHAGQAGLTKAEWGAKLAVLRPTDDCVSIVGTFAAQFVGNFIEKIGDRYRIGANGSAEAIDGDLETHVEVMSEFMKHTQTMEDFSLNTLARVGRRLGLTGEQSMQAARHFMDQHGHMFVELGNGLYAAKDEDRRGGKTDYSQMFRDIANDSFKLRDN
jgi:hypothetical protein